MTAPESANKPVCSKDCFQGSTAQMELRVRIKAARLVPSLLSKKVNEGSVPYDGSLSESSKEGSEPLFSITQNVIEFSGLTDPGPSLFLNVHYCADSFYGHP